jgi:AraC family transcriptional regulator
MLMRWLIELAARPSTPACAAAFGAVLAAYGEPAPPPGAELVERVRRFVRARIETRIRLADLAAAEHLSPFHFARRFRVASGCSPMAFVRAERIAMARGLLLATGMPLRAIAGRTGFADEFQLSRVFRRQTGQPPSAVRGGRVSARG